MPPAKAAPEQAALGVTVRVKGPDDVEKVYRIVTREEQAITGEGCSVESPLGRALLGARLGDVREVKTPRGQVELEILALTGDAVGP